MVKSKKIILPFLFLAWTIIFVHSIIPHHHHSDDLFTNAHSYLNNFSENTEIHDCDENCNGFVCHFHVKVLTQISVDQMFFICTEDAFINNHNLINEPCIGFYSGMISEQNPKIKFLRGPPLINFS